MPGSSLAKSKAVPFGADFGVSSYDALNYGRSESGEDLPRFIAPFGVRELLSKINIDHSQHAADDGCEWRLYYAISSTMNKVKT
jgi:hypothetical protein